MVRNGVRRRLRHLMRDRLGQLPTDASLVVRANAAAAAMPARALVTDLDRALSRALARTTAPEASR